MTKVYIVIVRSYGEFDYILGCYESEELASEDIKNLEIIDKRNESSPNDYLIEEFELTKVKEVIEKMEIEPTPKYTTGTIYLKTEGENNE